MSRRSIGVELALGAIGAAIIVVAAMLFVFAWPAAAGAQEAAPDTACHTAGTLVADLFSGEKVAAYRYAGADAAALYAAVAATDPEDIATVATTITVIDVPADDVVAFFMYGADGCYFIHVETSTDQAAAMFAAAKLIPPFGGIST